MTKIEFLVMTAIIVIGLASVLLSFSSSFIHFSSLGAGSHAGYITAVEQEGYIFRNYRVYVKTDLSSSQEDIYCLHRDKVEMANKAKEHAINKKPVAVEYNGVRGIGLGLCSGYEVTGIK